ncbi:formate dehydrogenase, gamma subunit [Candidatus Kryptonium thompsonii]|uniref:Formate dehydrogenase, gamma subunit n=4 Tax=Candidatus Kryptonium thompsonii TaxID=1633631 RepID=A0A0P1P6H3_9BACT|nr:cytochrome c3 family protein [Candidatus Kryptonium thompsoni]CUS78001.1 formate dehydrogenase, gamma subunit [Candidatus Kryptonium thompsoni]CUS81494.1 formate dehydrogenase, gamma subunit [Candidatus Kryptonium thompsoni]CUS87145.1 formate dehydrogenase, gamma subunit [Candidatus Kryptonium thompsoni]CUS89189.1 formate dehydrogenase, gamma subunit [Candidatus Kryptonium thompsoni]CUS91525.1 formate dehydrogenase, gamma subunit [Candidatus Kryptonium thompsoni]
MIKKFLAVMFLGIVFVSKLFSQSNAECFSCHDDKTLTMERHGKIISLYVDPKKFENSTHGALSCVDCHIGFNPEEIPHKGKIEPVDCSPCHSMEVSGFKSSKHSLKLKCASCHGGIHEIVKVSRDIFVNKCSSCHKKEFEDFRTSVHFSFNKGADCIACHGSHSIKFASSDVCLRCHSDKKIVHEHQEFVLKYKESIHAKYINCSDCHTGHKVLKASDPNSTVARANIGRTCEKCHKQVALNYFESEHGKAFLSGFKSAPTCTDCHGEHDIMKVTSSESKISRANEIKVCLKCHLDDPDVRSRMTHTSAFIASYEKSIHGRLYHSGNQDAAVCSDCHGAHEMMKASDPNSRVYKFNVVSTCGNCHVKISNEFKESIHGVALAKGNLDSPTCTDCHGEHLILEPTDPRSPVAPRNVALQLCSKCHASVKLAEKYGLPSDKFRTFTDSYHGLNVRLGNVEAANCASCHGVHDILPSSDPRSSIHKANLVKTCGQCHPGANENFVKGRIHVTVASTDEKIIYWVSTIYIVLIVSVVGSMFVHNLLDWIRKTIDKYRQRHTKLAHPPNELPRKTNLYLRMTLEERIQHFALVISFFTLVITGFMLAFPDAWWVVGIRNLGGEAIFKYRGLIHRIAAVILVLDSIYHLYYIIFTKRGREFIRDIMFRMQDIRDMVQVLKYNLGISKTKPKFGRFNYIEKSEYWALIWGTVVMTVTGIVLWFENHFMGWFSKTFVDVCNTIHYFEAWLAFLAIIVWHIYYVIFNPDVYPMNFAWLTGYLTEEEMEKEHPLELERIKLQEIKKGEMV